MTGDRIGHPDDRMPVFIGPDGNLGLAVQEDTVRHFVKRSLLRSLLRAALSMPAGHYNGMGRIFVGLLLYLLCVPVPFAAAPVSSDEVYADVLRIESETALIRRSLGISANVAPVPRIEANLLPRHSLAQGCVLLAKINFFRRQRGMPDAPPAMIAPYRNLEPFHTWAQTQRILTEISIIKRWLDITGDVQPIAPVSGKHPIDVFNRMRQVSADWNALVGGGGVLPAHVYGEATHLAEETRILLSFLGIADNAAPPPRNPNALPQDSLREVFAALTEIQRLQAQASIVPTDFMAFHKSEDVQPDDVLTMLALTLGELQILKAHIGLQHNVAPIRSYYPDKQPADVQQVIGYATNRLRLIRTVGR